MFTLHSDNETWKVIVTAEVTRGYTPVTGVKVELQVGSSPWKQMKDDGIGNFKCVLYTHKCTKVNTLTHASL